MSDRSSYTPVLLMESHGLAPNVRSNSFSSIKVWSKLYQAGPFFVDLTLGPGDNALALHGELMSESQPLPSEAIVTLRDQQGATVSTISASHGSFNFDVDAEGSYQLEMSFGDEVLNLPDIEVR